MITESDGTHVFQNTGDQATPKGLLECLDQSSILLQPNTRKIIQASEPLFQAKPPRDVTLRQPTGIWKLMYSWQESPTDLSAFLRILIPGMDNAKETLPSFGIGSLRLLKDEICSASWYFPLKKTDVCITGEVLTRGAERPGDLDFQNMGLGTSLTLLSNVVIRNVLRNNPVLLDKPVYALKRDRAKAYGTTKVRREDWTSNLAEMLNYDLDTTDTQDKVYRYNFNAR